MKILVTGGNGQLGWELGRQGDGFGHTIVSTDVSELDITDLTAVRAFLSRTSADIVVNAAAYTAVDRAETEVDLAYAVNAEGPRCLAVACEDRDIPLIHVSTDYVFDGSKPGPYLETDPVSPLGVYGKSKEEGERHVAENCVRHLIIRTAWFYGVEGQNFVKTMLRLGSERKEIGVVADQRGCPTFAADLAGAILAIAGRIEAGEKVPSGTCHYCGAGETTWHGFASKIFEIASDYTTLKIERVLPLRTEEYPTPAARPANSVMDCSRMTEWFGIAPPAWEESLAAMMKRLLEVVK